MKKNILRVIFCVFLFVFAFTMVLFCSGNKIVIIGGSSACSYEKDDIHITDKAGWSEYITSYIDDFNVINFSKENVLISKHKENAELIKLLNNLSKKDKVVIQLEEKDYNDINLIENIELLITPIISKGTEIYLILPHHLDLSAKNRDSEIKFFAEKNNFKLIDPNINICTYVKRNFLFSPYKDKNLGYDHNGFNSIYAQIFAEALSDALSTGEFRWDSVNYNITRGMFINDILNFAGVSTQKGNLFNDVKNTHKYAKAIAVAKSMGIIYGDNAGCFRPDDIISVGDAAIITVNLLKKNNYTFDNYFYTLWVEPYKQLINSYVDNEELWYDIGKKSASSLLAVDEYAAEAYNNLTYAYPDELGLFYSLGNTGNINKYYTILSMYNLIYAKLYNA